MMKKSFFRYGKYQMRSADYYHMLADQRNRCAICNKEPADGERLVIDHDHLEENEDTSAVRGLRCINCNLLLGQAKDDPTILLSAMEYLQKGGHPSRFYIEGGKLLTNFNSQL